MLLPLTQFPIYKENAIRTAFWRTRKWSNQTIRSESQISSDIDERLGDAPSARQEGPCAMLEKSRSYSLQTLRCNKRVTLPKFMSKASTQKEVPRRKRRTFHLQMQMVSYEWQDQVLRFDHPTEFGKHRRRRSTPQ